MPKGADTSSGAIVINGALLTNNKQLARFQKKTTKQLALIQRTEKDNVTRRLFVGLALHVVESLRRVADEVEKAAKPLLKK